MYKINEIFESLQGEGFFTGTPSLFIRFSGCNLKCPFCDTRHQDGRMWALEDLISEVKKSALLHVVLTGGEPGLFVDKPLIEALHGCDKFVCIETNGTQALPSEIDWITLSPKIDIFPDISLALQSADELKVVYQGQDLSQYDNIRAPHRYLQPCDSGNPEENSKNIKQTIAMCMAHPTWSLSLQTHKIIGIR